MFSVEGEIGEIFGAGVGGAGSFEVVEGQGTLKQSLGDTYEGGGLGNGIW